MTCLRHLFFCFNDTATTEIYTLSLHDALPILELNTKAEGVRSVNGIAALVVQTQRLVYHRRVDHRRKSAVTGNRSQVIDRQREPQIANVSRPYGHRPAQCYIVNVKIIAPLKIGRASCRD